MIQAFASESSAVDIGFEEFTRVSISQSFPSHAINCLKGSYNMWSSLSYSLHSIALHRDRFD